MPVNPLVLYLIAALALTVVAAVVERPFYSAGGIRQHAIWYSIRANVVSAVICVLFVYPALVIVRGFDPEPHWLAFIVLVSTLIERRELRAYTQVRLSFGRVLIANVASGAVWLLFGVLLNAADKPHLRVTVQPYQATFSLILAVGCMLAVVAAFVIPFVARRRNTPSAEQPTTTLDPTFTSPPQPS